MFVAPPPERIARSEINARIESQKGCNRLIHRDMHPLPAPADLGRIESREAALRSSEPGNEISNGGADLMRWSVTRPGQIHETGLALDDHIIAGSILLRSGIAEARDGAIDHRRALQKSTAS